MIYSLKHSLRDSRDFCRQQKGMRNTHGKIGNQCTRAQPSTRCDSPDKATFFHCSVVQF
ncbi:hypothetical protein UPYG_G00075470 [Umbra pygmaea]|uniref:Uncharacterized protein n=1 Tax=Umbra pygmaea TaxID=75934 RepID=A0ABD0XCM3_UMBPY